MFMNWQFQCMRELLEVMVQWKYGEHKLAITLCMAFIASKSSQRRIHETVRGHEMIVLN